jgi:hypothetical protein
MNQWLVSERVHAAVNVDFRVFTAAAIASGIAAVVISDTLLYARSNRPLVDPLLTALARCRMRQRKRKRANWLGLAGLRPKPISTITMLLV